MNQETSIIDIENEYTKINSKWLRLHFNTSLGLVIFSIFVECFIGIVVYKTDQITTSIPRYLLKYLMIPIMLNSIFIIGDYWVLKSSKISHKAKIYFISFVFVGISFVLYVVHSAFSALYLIYTIPILLTMVYSDFLLTTVIAISSIIADIVAELFIHWDPDKVTIMESGWKLADFLVSLCILSAFYAVCMVAIRYLREKNDASIQKELERIQLQLKLQIDDLTSIHNRIALRNAFTNMEQDSESSYIFAMLDIDNFKMLNDTLGHSKGDLCLKNFGSILKSNCEEAMSFRFGGDEFCILFKNQELQNVIGICKQIQSDFKELALSIAPNLPLTISIGIAHYTEEITASQLIKNTDLALYRSKEIKDTIYVFGG